MFFLFYYFVSIDPTPSHHSLMASSYSSLTLTYRNTTQDSTSQQKPVKSNHNDDDSLIFTNSKFLQSMSISIESNSIDNKHLANTFNYNDKNDELKIKSISVSSNDLTSRTRAELKKGINEFKSNENMKKFNLENKPTDSSISNDLFSSDSTFYWLPLTSMDNQFLITAEW